MCGICGYVSFSGKKASEGIVTSMMEKMKHRGPDDEGIFILENIALGFVRLSIIDLSEHGHQPMADLSGKYVIIFNGEIYNYLELKDELLQLGYQFRSTSDTEVLLYAYMEWGPECLDRLNGMFAFAVLHTKERTIFIARDRFGIKPLYYYLDREMVIFASEIPPILQVYGKRNEPNRQALYDYLLYNRTDHNESTFFDQIRKLPHGHTMQIGDGHIKISKWYSLEENLHRPAMNSSEYLELLKSSTRLRLRSDVPLGVCLSGGIDSSTITSLLSVAFQKKDLNTFSAIYGNNMTGDESEYINEYKDDLKNMHFAVPDAKSLFSDQKSFIRAHAEPFPTTGIYAQYKVMQLASGKVKVLLDGQGADEQLAGYHYFFGIYFRELFNTLRWLILIQEMHHTWINHRSFYPYRVFLSTFLPPGMIRSHKQQLTPVHPEFSETVDRESQQVYSLLKSTSLHQSLLNHFKFKLEHLLKWEDRNSMWFSIESRVPFLDFRLVEATLSQASDRLIKHGNTKVILRESTRGTLPERIRRRKDKIGFQTPEGEWFREPFYVEFINDLLASDSFRDRGIIHNTRALKNYKEHLSGRTNASKEIWKWINMELWFREFID